MSQRTRVLVVIDSLLAGGAERVAVQTACGLDPTEFEVTLVATRRTGPLRDILDAAPIAYQVLGRRSRFHVRPLLRLAREIHRADVVHSHKYGSNVWSAMLCALMRRPLIVHKHSGNTQCSQLRRVLERHLIYRVASRVLCASESVAAIARNGGAQAETIVVVENAVLGAPLLSRADARREMGLKTEAFVIGMVAGLRPEKSHETMLEALAILQKHPDPQPWTLCCIGTGPREHMLRERADALGIAELIRWVGERPAAADFMTAFDVSVMCSDFEGLPLAALEALGARVPLIATSVGQLPSLLRDGAGLLVNPRDPQSLAAAILSLRNDPHQAQALADAGYVRVQQDHSFERFTGALEQIYRDVMQRHSPAQTTESNVTDTKMNDQAGEAA